MNRSLAILQCGALVLLAACGSETSTPAAKTAPAPAASAPAIPPPAASPGAAPSPDPAYEATLAEGIQFQREGYPRFISSVTGISGREEFGRWSDAGTVIFTFAEPLPKKFLLSVETTAAYAANAGKPLRVKVGDWAGQAVIGTMPQTAEFRVASTVAPRTIEFTIAQPTSPKQLGTGDDTRTLGIAFKRLTITTP